jgi:hypothetical protein
MVRGGGSVVSRESCSERGECRPWNDEARSGADAFPEAGESLDKLSACFERSERRSPSALADRPPPPESARQSHRSEAGRRVLPAARRASHLTFLLERPVNSKSRRSTSVTCSSETRQLDASEGVLSYYIYLLVSRIINLSETQTRAIPNLMTCMCAVGAGAGQPRRTARTDRACSTIRGELGGEPSETVGRLTPPDHPAAF